MCNKINKITRVVEILQIHGSNLGKNVFLLDSKSFHFLKRVPTCRRFTDSVLCLSLHGPRTGDIVTETLSFTNQGKMSTLSTPVCRNSTNLSQRFKDKRKDVGSTRCMTGLRGSGLRVSVPITYKERTPKDSHKVSGTRISFPY